MRYTEFSSGEMFLKRRSGQQLMDYGDWIIQNLDGDPEWFTNEVFQEIYEKAE